MLAAATVRQAGDSARRAPSQLQRGRIRQGPAGASDWRQLQAVERARPSGVGPFPRNPGRDVSARFCRIEIQPMRRRAARTHQLQAAETGALDLKRFGGKIQLPSGLLVDAQRGGADALALHDQPRDLQLQRRFRHVAVQARIDAPVDLALPWPGQSEVECRQLQLQLVGRGNAHRDPAGAPLQVELSAVRMRVDAIERAAGADRGRAQLAAQLGDGQRPAGLLADGGIQPRRGIDDCPARAAPAVPDRARWRPG